MASPGGGSRALSAGALWSSRRPTESGGAALAEGRLDCQDALVSGDHVLLCPRAVTALFDGGARYYDWVCGIASLGSGQFYRRWVLAHSGLGGGMKLLDVATGTGLVARAALRILREPGAVIGLDPSRGMLEEARKA